MLTRVRPYVSIAVLAALIFYFGFQALTGDRGLLARARLLRDGTLSRDLLEERARSLLGLSDPRDYVIRTERPRAG